MYSAWVGVVTLLLCGSSLAGEIKVNLKTAPIVNENVNITIPRVTNVLFEFEGRKLEPVGSDQVCVSVGDAVRCTLNQNDDSYSWNFDKVVQDSLVRVTVNAQANDDYEFGCSTYQFPVQLNLAERTGQLTCVPLFVNSSVNATSMTWYRSPDPSGAGAVLVNHTRVNTNNTDGVINSSLLFHSADLSDAAYYFPVATDGVTTSNRSAPILVTYQPIIRSPIVEFSEDIYINPSFPPMKTFTCDISSFPIATVLWRYNRTKIVGAKNVTLPCYAAECPPSAMNQTDAQPIPKPELDDYKDERTLRYTLTLLNVTFDDYGIYTCFPENPAFLAEITVEPTSSNAHSFRIKVKDHLRQLWPAIGIICVFILVALCILLGALYDHFFPKGSKKKNSSSASHRQLTSTSSGSPDVVHSKLTDGHLHLRRISSAQVQLLEESSN